MAAAAGTKADMYGVPLIALGVALVAWVLATPGDQFVPAFIGGYSIGLGIWLLVFAALRRRDLL